MQIVKRPTFEIGDRVMEVAPLIGLILLHQLGHARSVEPDGFPSCLVLDIRVESVARNLARHGRQAVVPEMRVERAGWREKRPVARDALGGAKGKV